MAAAISSGCPGRPAGRPAASWSSASPMVRVPSVRVGPGGCQRVADVSLLRRQERPHPRRHRSPDRWHPGRPATRARRTRQLCCARAVARSAHRHAGGAALRRLRCKVDSCSPRPAATPRPCEPASTRSWPTSVPTQPNPSPHTRSESAGLQERSGDVVGQVPEAESRSAAVLQAAADRFGGAWRWCLPQPPTVTLRLQVIDYPAIDRGSHDSAARHVEMVLKEETARIETSRRNRISRASTSPRTPHGHIPHEHRYAPGADWYPGACLVVRC